VAGLRGFYIVAVGYSRLGLTLRLRTPGATRAASYRKREALGGISCPPSRNQAPGTGQEWSYAGR
jgi:hypothetical protein